MAEAHPVAFQWVVEAKARGATVIHIDPHYSRTARSRTCSCRSAPGSDIAFLGGDHQPRHLRRNRTSASTSCATRTRRRSSARTSRTPAPAGSSPASRRRRAHTTRPAGSTRAPSSPPPPGSATSRRVLPSPEGGAGGRCKDRGTPKLDMTLEHPRCVWQILKRHYARYTPEMVERVCGVDPQDVFPRCASCSSKNSGRERTTAFVHGVGWTPAHDRLAVHPRGLDPATAARQHGPPGRGRDGDARPRLDPGLERHPDAVRHAARLHPDAARPPPRGPRRVTSRATRPTRASGATCATTSVSLLKAYLGEAATAENDCCFEYLPRLTGSHRTYDTVMAQVEGSRQGLLPVRAEPRRRLGEQPHAAAGDVEARLARRARLLADRVGDLVEGRPRDRERGDAHRGDRRPRSSSCRPRRTPRRTGPSRTPSAWCSGTTRRSSRRGTSARPVVHLPPRAHDPRAARGRRDTGATSATGRSSTSPGTTRPRARTTIRAPTPCCARSTAGTPTASCSPPTPN